MFFNKNSIMSLNIFHSQSHIENMLGKKITFMHNNGTFHGTNVFSLSAQLFIVPTIKLLCKQNNIL